MWDFLQLQAEKFNAGDLAGLSVDFELPFVITHGRDAWVILSEADLIKHLRCLRTHLQRIGMVRLERHHRRFQAAMEVMTMVSFKDVFLDRAGGPIGSIDYTFATQNRSDTLRISIVMIDNISDSLWRSGLRLDRTADAMRRIAPG